MNIVASIFVGIIALLHLYFLVLEMFLWTKPTGRRTFGLDADFAERSKGLAANQGLYNGFLAAGLIYGLVQDNFEFKVFFLVCVIIAGLYGGFTVKRSILFIQALPAVIALFLVVLAR
jgi:putative membrane protein